MSDDENTSPEKTTGKRGRPKEESIKLSREARRLLDTRAAHDAEKIYTALLAAALNGCAQSMSMIVQRIWPTRKGTVLSLDGVSTPTISKPEHIGPAMEWVWAQVIAGRLSTDEGTQLGALIQQRASAFEVADLAKELEELRAQVQSVLGVRAAA